MIQPEPVLSICIPVKDFDVRPLAEALLKEIREYQLPAEIIILEDGSQQQNKLLNSSLLQEPEVSILVFENNKGRSAARNFIATKANGEYLLFIDADSLPVSPSFLNLYLLQRDPRTIISGGSHYSNHYRHKECLLHWKYGMHREVASAMKVNRTGFQSNNFLINSKTFADVRFDESIVLYGHEDTLFGVVAKSKGLRIVTIDNPVIHTGLESNMVFLAKTEEGVRSLLQIISQEEKYPFDLAKEFRLWLAYKKIKKYKLTWLLTLFTPLLAPIRNTLRIFSGPLLLFDFYKLLLLHKGLVAIKSSNK